MNILLIGPNNVRKDGGPTGICKRILAELQKKEDISVNFLYVSKHSKINDLLRIIKYIWINKNHIINIHSGNKLPYILAFLPFRKRGRIILTIHGYENIEKDLSIAKHLFYSVFNNLCFKRYSYISFVSNYLKECLENKIELKSKKYLTLNGLDDSLINISVRNEKKMNNVIFIGGTRYNKGLDILLRSLISCNRKYQLEVFGENGNYHAECQQLALIYKKKGGQVIFHGIQLKETIYEYLNKSSICVIPSRFDTFNVALLEAMFFKNIVVSSKDVGANTYIEDTINGYLFSTQYELEKLLNAIDPEHCDSLRENAHKTALKTLWSKQINSYLCMYRDINSRINKL